MTTSQRLIERELDAAIKSTQSMRHCAKRGVAANERICCDGGCNDNQGRGYCPRFAPSKPNPPSEAEWAWAEGVVLAIGLGCIAAVILSATGVWQ